MTTTTTEAKRQDRARSAEVCDDCGLGLKEAEAKAFFYRCESCQLDHVARVRSWMGGIPDRYLDVYYQNTQTRFKH